MIPIETFNKFMPKELIIPIETFKKSMSKEGDDSIWDIKKIMPKETNWDIQNINNITGVLRCWKGKKKNSYIRMKQIILHNSASSRVFARETPRLLLRDKVFKLKLTACLFKWSYISSILSSITTFSIQSTFNFFKKTSIFFTLIFFFLT
jgi:hypothetical protein